MKKRLTNVAKKLRKQQTPHENKLWYLLRSKRLANLKFRRQYPIGNYIVDFCCPTKKVIIELDGSGHTEQSQEKKDRIRNNFLKSQGFKILRIWNSELIENEDEVLDEIYQLVKTPPLPRLPASKAAGDGGQAVPLPPGERGRFETHSEKQTIALGKKIAKKLNGGEVLALYGELGAGKTTLVKGLAAGLGIKKAITSPTFLLMRVYPIKNKKIKQLIHLDCYRIKKVEEIEALGLEEYFKRDDVLIVIEWPEKIKKLLPRQTMIIKLELIKENIRKITINYA